MTRMIMAIGVAGMLATAPAFAQTTTTPSAPTAPMAAPAEKVDQLMNKSVYSSDNKNLGSVVAVTRDSDGKISKINADIGGFLGLGQHRIALTPSQFTVGADNVLLKMTAEQAKALPAVTNK